MAGKDNLKPMVKGETRNPNGRPKKVETVLKELFLAEYNVKLSAGQTSDIIQSILTKSRTELIDLAKNEELPFSDSNTAFFLKKSRIPSARSYWPVLINVHAVNALSYKEIKLL